MNDFLAVNTFGDFQCERSKFAHLVHIFKIYLSAGKNILA